MNRIFIGFDQRQCVSYTVLHTSIVTQSRKPCSITPLIIDQLPIKRTGLTPFTFSRFLVPHLCGYDGWALFLDSDMLLAADVSKLFDLADDRYAVQVVKNEKKFEWASAMLFNCSHPENKILTPEYIEEAKGLHQIGWLHQSLIGDLPREWNHLVGYDAPTKDAKLIHYTQGIPAYQETQDCEFSKEWKYLLQFAISSEPWETLMGNSVHAVSVGDKKLPRYVVEDMLLKGTIKGHLEEVRV